MAAAQLSGVEPSNRRQQRRVTRGQRGGLGTRRSGWTNGGPGRKPWAAVQPPYRLGKGQALDPLDEVQHVAAFTAAEAVELLGV